MYIHFPSFNAAVKHLKNNGWRNFVQCDIDFWLSRDGTCEARVLTCPGSTNVVITGWEI
jgi:hypothetical protein